MFLIFLWVFGTKGFNKAVIKDQKLPKFSSWMGTCRPRKKKSLCLEQKWSRLNHKIFCKVKKILNQCWWLTLLRMIYMCTFTLLVYFYWDRVDFVLFHLFSFGLGFFQFGSAKEGVSLTSTAQRNRNMKTDCSCIHIHTCSNQSNC